MVTALIGFAFVIAAIFARCRLQSLKAATLKVAAVLKMIISMI